MEEISLWVNGRRFSLLIEPGESINYVIRERLGLTGTKRGCETGGCGSCTIIVDGKAVYSCMMYAMQAVGKSILTIEGLQKSGNKLDPIQESFMDKGGLQCGYCTPGFIMASKALIDKIPDPTEEQIKDALVGNLCRCTGYTKIFESVKAASALAARQKK